MFWGFIKTSKYRDTVPKECGGKDTPTGDDKPKRTPAASKPDAAEYYTVSIHAQRKDADTTMGHAWISLEDSHVLIVEDIVDSGVTLNYLIHLLEQRRPKSIRIAALLDKPDRRLRPVHVSYVGFKIPDEFVVGYGLDYAEKYRNLPDVCVVPRE